MHCLWWTKAKSSARVKASQLLLPENLLNTGVTYNDLLTFHQYFSHFLSFFCDLISVHHIDTSYAQHLMGLLILSNQANAYAKKALCIFLIFILFRQLSIKLFVPIQHVGTTHSLFFPWNKPSNKVAFPVQFSQNASRPICWESSWNLTAIRPWSPLHLPRRALAAFS